jgi:hypothetical protein
VSAVFDTISGLPVHALVVHAVVVLLPLLSLVTIVFVIRPHWRPELPWAVLGNALVLAATYTAKESGEKLQARLSGLTGGPVAEAHAKLATVLPYYALAQLVASVIAYLLVRQSSRTPEAFPAMGGYERYETAESDQTPEPGTFRLALAITLVLVAGVAATIWTYRVGDSGARAVWEDTIASTHAG